jgi:archaellum component FlaC
MSISLETIYKELQDIKERLDRIEKSIMLSEEEFSDDEIKQLKSISEEMSQGDKILWKSK